MEYQKVDELETRELVHQQYPGVEENHHKITLDYKHFIAQTGSGVQMLDSTIHRITHYPADIYYKGKQFRYPVHSDLSSGKHYPPLEQLGPGD